jgi:hypothetical protein
MPTYLVRRYCSTFVTFEVDAESEEEALENCPRFDEDKFAQVTEAITNMEPMGEAEIEED